MDKEENILKYNHGEKCENYCHICKKEFSTDDSDKEYYKVEITVITVENVEENIDIEKEKYIKIYRRNSYGIS